MTAQINDRFLLKGKDYTLAGISSGPLFSPKAYELKPRGTTTACWRGWRGTYSVKAGELVLHKLEINLFGSEDYSKPVAGPKIHGVEPKLLADEEMFVSAYDPLDMPLPYTGGLLLADGFIRDLYVHMGFHPAWKYERVLELVFKKGKLHQQFDRSKRVAEIRKKVATEGKGGATLAPPVENEPPSAKDKAAIEAFIEKSFDRSYSMGL